jgi:hypothetical protein
MTIYVDHTLNITLVTTLSSSYNLEANIWFKHYMHTNPISITQCKYLFIEIVINYQNHTWGLRWGSGQITKN